MTHIPSDSNKDFCFCTLALGDNYSLLASQLAKDLEQYSPKTNFVVLTNKPENFSSNANVLAFKHRQQSIGCYHDKRFVITKALSLFNSCIFVDADMRILAPITGELNWLPGITAHIVLNNLLKTINKNKKQSEFEFKLLEKMAKKLNLNLENISFVHECLFVVTRDSGKEQEFLKYWEDISKYFELHGFYRGEGNTIGLAAAKAGLTIRRDQMENIVFFKDKLEIQKIKKGKVDPQKKAIYFEMQNRIEYPKHRFLNRFWNKLSKTISYFYRSCYLRIITLKDFNFYYR